MFQSRNTAQSSDVYKPSISCIDFQFKPCGQGNCHTLYENAPVIIKTNRERQQVDDGR